jgi:hypothetical protein
VGISFSGTSEKPLDSGLFDRTIPRLKADCPVKDGQMGNLGEAGFALEFDTRISSLQSAIEQEKEQR